MVELPLKYQILNALRVPLTINELSDKLQVSEAIIKNYCRTLRKANDIKLVSTKTSDFNTIEYIYEVHRSKKYSICYKCKEVYEVTKIYNNICIYCTQVYNEDQYFDLGTSYTQIQHMQNVINEQKQMIYKLQQENHLLKKKL